MTALLLFISLIFGFHAQMYGTDYVVDINSHVQIGYETTTGEFWTATN